MGSLAGTGLIPQSRHSVCTHVVCWRPLVNKSKSLGASAAVTGRKGT